MNLNDGFSETYIFWIKHDIFKVVLNFNKKMCTVYSSNGRILMRKEKLTIIEMNKLRNKIRAYLDSDKLSKYNFLNNGMIL